MTKNKITQITRKAIFDEIRISDLCYIPIEMDDVEFWNRIYNLAELPTTDTRFSNMAGDMWQHRVNNPSDWDDYWFLSDSRINMMSCSDEDFLKFLSETVHPLVRTDKDSVKQLLDIYNQHLKEDGFEIAVIQTISGKGIYSGKKLSENRSVNRSFEEVSQKVNYLDNKYLQKQIALMKIQISASPELTIGLSKEIIESFCKAVLEEREECDTDRYTFPQLVRKTNQHLKLVPDNVSKNTKGSESIKSLLGSITNIANKLDELRNLYGSGHGKGKNYKGLGTRHASLAVNLTATLLIFWSETYHDEIG